MKLSVVIPVFNQEKFISDTLNSVVAQKTNFPFEILIGDDTSSDQTRKILAEYAEKYAFIKVFYNTKNLGPNLNIVNLLNHAQGEYIAHLDGDDLMLPGKLQKQVRLLDQHPEYSICAHAMSVINEKGKKRPFRYSASQTYTREYLVRNGCTFVHSSKVFRKSAIPPEGFDTSTTRVGDFLWHIQNAAYGKVAFLGEILGTYRKHTQGMSFANSINEKYILETLKDLIYSIDYAEKHGVSQEACEFGRARVYFQTALFFLRKKNFRRFQEYFEKSKIYSFSTKKRKIFWLLRKHPALLYWLLFPLSFILNHLFYK